MNPALDTLKAQIEKATTVEASADTLIKGISQRVNDAVNAALANGATAEQLQPVSDVANALDAESDVLQASIVANTPAAPPA